MLALRKTHVGISKGKATVFLEEENRGSEEESGISSVWLEYGFWVPGAVGSNPTCPTIIERGMREDGFN